MIRIRNWEKFQHYKDRSPPWIKLHRKLLDSREWGELEDAPARLLVELWLLASEESPGEVNLDIESLSWRLRKPSASTVVASLEVLKAKGFIEFATEPLAECKQDAPQRERQRQRTETEEETEDAPVGREATIEGGDVLKPNELLKEWIDRQLIPPDSQEKSKQAGKAKQLCSKHSRRDIALAFKGMGQLFPYSDGTPWDLFDLDRKFSKAKQAVVNHPEIQEQKRDAELRAELGIS